MDCFDEIYPKISGLIPEQFPNVYQDRGPVFVAFVKAYYEWLEEEGNATNKARNLLNYSNIDTTLDDFLVHFQRKYLYGIPFDVIINKRLLLKHIFDVYRSKSSLQCFQLLFRLIYNEDMEVYIPGRDLLRVSDGTWKDVRYIEVTDVPVNLDYVGKKIIGIVSQTTAIVESFIREPINQNIINTLYLSNINPRAGSFTRGEKVIVFEDYQSNNYANAVIAAPIIVGSLDSIELLNGGQNFAVGDVVKIAQRDITTNDLISFGRDGVLKVTDVRKGRGSLVFSIIDGGFGYQANSLTYTYNDPADTTGTGGGFDVNSISNAKILSYNTDIIVNYFDLALGAVTATFTTVDSDTVTADNANTTVDSTDNANYGFPTNETANLSTTLTDALDWSNGIFGSVASLTNIRGGENYVNAATTFVKEPNYTQPLEGQISYTTGSTTISGFDTRFDRAFANDMVIWLQANSAVPGSIETQVVKQVVNSTSLTLYGYPSNNSTPSALHKAGPNKLPSNYVAVDGFPYDPIYGDVTEFNANVSATPSIGNGVVAELTAIESGKGYVDGEIVQLYLYGGITNPIIEAGGTGYANGENLVFSGGAPLTYPEGTIETDANGTIISVTMTNNGSGFTETPTVLIQTVAGSGASLLTTLSEFNTSYQISGKVQKSGIGKRRGYWSTTRSHLNSDKYIQDSYFYQDFSYQVETALTLNKYSDILYDTFHIASTELFGKFKLITTSNNAFSVLHSNTAAATTFYNPVFADDTTITADSANTTVDSFTQWATADRTIITADELLPTVDFVE